MDVLTDDHEREQAVRKWWGENWKSITLGVVIALGGLIGYRQYQSYELEKSQAQAYELYQLQTQLSLNNSDAKDKATAFIKEHDDIYGALLALDLSSVQIASGDYEAARSNVQFAAKHGGDLIAPNAVLAEARLETQLKNYDKAHALINSIKSEAFAVEKAELSGDIYLQANDKDKARLAYKDAIELCKERKIAINPLLQSKFDSVIANGDTPAYKTAIELNTQIAEQGVQLR